MKTRGKNSTRNLKISRHNGMKTPCLDEIARDLGVSREELESRGFTEAALARADRKIEAMLEANRLNPNFTAEIDHGRILDEVIEMPVESIKPSPENELLYRPVSWNDPEIISLAESVGTHGIKEPLIVSEDGFIISGHRRLMAAKRAGLKTVPCRVEKIQHLDPQFTEILRECNRQRMKTLAEIAREEVVSMDPEESHRLLVEHRRRQSRIDTSNAIEIEGIKHRAEITSAKQPFLAAINAILRERADFWPLSVRSVHYALLNDPPLIHARKPHSRYANNLSSYKATIDLTARARIAGLIPWEAVDDETRPFTNWKRYQSIAPFLRDEFDSFLKGYYRNYQQSQPNHIEIVGEKNTIKSIIHPVAMEFGIPFTIGRGYSSLPPRQKMEGRFRKSGKERLIVLSLSDDDPEGEDIPHSFARSMRDDFDIDEIEVIKVALTRGQATGMDLPPMMKAKKKSSRYNKFVERYGDDVFELEALPPDRLQAILRKAIDNVLDVKLFNAEIEAEKRDATQLGALRRAVQQQLASLHLEEGSNDANP